MAQFKKIWAVESHQRFDEGETIPVSLKSGKTKIVRLGKLIQQTYVKGVSRYYYGPAESESAEA